MSLKGVVGMYNYANKNSINELHQQNKITPKNTTNPLSFHIKETKPILELPYCTTSIIQRTTASVQVGGTTVKGSEKTVAKGGVGGQTHAEQLAWNIAKTSVENSIRDNDETDITFVVDEPICDNSPHNPALRGCQGWFERLHKSLTKLAVENKHTFTLVVLAQGRQINITGEGTDWSNNIAPVVPTVPAPVKVTARNSKKEAKRAQQLEATERRREMVRASQKKQ